MRRTKIKAIMFGISLGLMGQAQAAENCSVLLDDLMAWAKTPIFGENSIGVTMTTNVNTRKFASYTTASLDYKPGFFTKFGFISERLIGDGETYFSDRTWDNAPSGCTGFCFSDLQPFSPKKKDKVRIALTKYLGDVTKANVSITLLSWGNAKVNFVAQCDNKHIYGFKADQHGTHLYDLTFSKDQITFPK